ncbi:MAG: SPOR domain-containing protein, partial [Shewanellaceae bacterium]|nr:SPOR domain-containing protein [Shewanellaceae bacterium]
LVKQRTFPVVDDSEFEQAKQKHIAQFSGQPEIKGVTVGEVIDTPTEAEPAANLRAASSLRPLPKGHAWTLQVGTFASAANVNRLLQQLSKQGWSVYTVPQTVVEGKLTRVFIGPELDQNRLKSIQKKIKETFKTKSVIVKFYPTHQVG